MANEEKKIVIITGGAGYIGSAVSLLMLLKGYKVIIIDTNMITGSLAQEAYKADNLIHIQNDFSDEIMLHQIFGHYKIEAVMHFAAFIDVGESVELPHYYYENNLVKTIKLLNTMRIHGLKNFVFSSSCAVYGTPESSPITENFARKPESPYGKTKLMVELILQDYAHSYNINSVALRYFNACGAWLEYNLGEQHIPETHIIPNLLKSVSSGKPFTVFGNDYLTPDGTCIRDFLHIEDLAQAHYLALKHLKNNSGYKAYNLGTGNGTSILELIKEVEEVTGSKIPVKFAPRRAGDPAILVADYKKAQLELGWQPRHSSLPNIISSAYHFHNNLAVHSEKQCKTLQV